MFYTSVFQFRCWLLSLVIQFIQEKPLWKVGNPYCRVQQSIKIAYWNLKIWSSRHWVSQCRVAWWWSVFSVGGKIGFKHIEEVNKQPPVIWAILIPSLLYPICDSVISLEIFVRRKQTKSTFIDFWAIRYLWAPIDCLPSKRAYFRVQSGSSVMDSFMFYVYEQ